MIKNIIFMLLIAQLLVAQFSYCPLINQTIDPSLFDPVRPNLLIDNLNPFGNPFVGWFWYNSRQNPGTLVRITNPTNPLPTLNFYQNNPQFPQISTSGSLYGNVWFISPVNLNQELPQTLFYWSTEPSNFAINPINQQPQFFVPFGIPTAIVRHGPDQEQWLFNGKSICKAPDSSQNQPQPDMLIRKLFFSDIVGISEEEFRKKINWDINPSPVTVKTEQEKLEWIREYSRRAAIFQGNFKVLTVQDLDAYLKANKTPLTNNPYFKILIFDPENPQESDIRYLQAHNYNAIFQLASTFKALEGGMGDPKALLVDMIPHAVQGEEASISAAGATIYRKYFMNPVNLLKKLEPKIKININGTIKNTKEINNKKYTFDNSDIQHVGIGLHDGIVVTSGYGEFGSDGKQERLPVILDNNFNLIPEKNQIISQVFTAAISTSFLRSKNYLTPELINLAKILLKGSYQATVEAAFYAKKPKIFLTLVGAGAFRNEIAWLSEAIDRKEIKDCIKTRGLQVSLLYRPDKKRDYPVRTAQEDQKFLKNMINMTIEITGIHPQDRKKLDTLIDSYVQKAYEYEQNQTDAHKIETGKLARKLQKEISLLTPLNLQKDLITLETTLFSLKNIL